MWRSVGALPARHWASPDFSPPSKVFLRTPQSSGLFTMMTRRPCPIASTGDSIEMLRIRVQEAPRWCTRFLSWCPARDPCLALLRTPQWDEELAPLAGKTSPCALLSSGLLSFDSKAGFPSKKPHGERVCQLRARMRRADKTVPSCPCNFTTRHSFGRARTDRRWRL